MFSDWVRVTFILDCVDPLTVDGNIRPVTSSLGLTTGSSRKPSGISAKMSSSSSNITLLSFVHLEVVRGCTAAGGAVPRKNWEFSKMHYVNTPIFQHSEGIHKQKEDFIATQRILELKCGPSKHIQAVISITPTQGIWDRWQMRIHQRATRLQSSHTKCSIFTHAKISKTLRIISKTLINGRNISTVDTSGHIFIDEVVSMVMFYIYVFQHRYVRSGKHVCVRVW